LELEILHGSFGAANQVNFSNFVTDHFPYLRRIHPHATSTRNLYSHVEKESFKSSDTNKAAELMAEEQAAILALDDIEDFSDEDDVKVGLL
jgi:hypothetical protein